MESSREAGPTETRLSLGVFSARPVSRQAARHLVLKAVLGDYEAFGQLQLVAQVGFPRVVGLFDPPPVVKLMVEYIFSKAIHCGSVQEEENRKMQGGSSGVAPGSVTF